MKLKYFGRVDDQGRILITNKKRFQEDCLNHFEGKRVVMTVEAKKKTRSSLQNRYLWGCMYPIMRECFIDAGNQNVTIEDVHYFLKQRFLDNGKEILDPETGELVKGEPTTTELTTMEFDTYKNQIQQFAAEYFNANIPDPEEQVSIF